MMRALLWLISGLGCQSEQIALSPAPPLEADAPANELTEPRVLLVGMDGLDLGMLQELMDAGKLPHFQRLAREGVLTELQTTRPILSPIIWTSIASGYRAEQHGIAGWSRGNGEAFTAQDVATDRIWDTASKAGISVFVSGWLMTWPAAELQGEMLSERLVLSFPMNKDPTDESVQISRRSHRHAAKLTSPADLISTAQEWVPDPAEAPDYLTHQISEFGAPFHPWVRDETQLRALEARWGESRARLGMILLVSADQVSHLYWPFTSDLVQRQLRKDPSLRMRAAADDRESRSGRRAYPYSEAPITPVELHAGAAWVPETYRWLDEALGRVMGLVDPTRTTLILCSDHGFQTGRNSPVLNGGHRSPGVLGLWGGATQREATSEASILDIGPTLYRLLELPLAEDMPGAPLDSLLTLPAPVAEVRSYLREPERAPLPSDSGAPLHRKQLEALGYIDAEGSPLPRSRTDEIHR